METLKQVIQAEFTLNHSVKEYQFGFLLKNGLFYQH